MTFAISSAGPAGKLTVCVSTSGEVTITITATELRFSEKQFQTALEHGRVQVNRNRPTVKASRIDPVFQAR